MLDRDLLADVLDTALKKGGQFADIYIEDRLTSNIMCDDDRIERIHRGREKARESDSSRMAALSMFTPMICPGKA